VIFSVVVTVTLAALVLYAFLQYRQFPLVGRTLPLVCAFGIYAAWFPDSTTAIAQLVGIGRGADLMLYTWVLASLLLIFVLHLKLVALGRRLTELARAVAIADARRPAEPPPGE
jgi:hypothetical protein